MKKNKGEYGYIHSQKIKRTLITIVMFAIPITIFITGLIITKTRLNMFTFVAIMGCLPASRSATGLAMMLMQKPASEELHTRVESVRGKVTVLYDMVFTAYQKNVPVDCVSVSDTQVIGYVSSKKADIPFGENHIREILRSNGCKSAGVKLFRDEKPFLDQVKLMNKKISEDGKDSGTKAEYICEVLKAIVL